MKKTFGDAYGFQFQQILPDGLQDGFFFVARRDQIRRAIVVVILDWRQRLAVYLAVQVERQCLSRYIGVRQHVGRQQRSEEHTSELQSLMRISYAVFCLKKKKKKRQ